MRIKALLFTLLIPFAYGCTVDGGDDHSGDRLRGPKGKSDSLSGSCQTEDTDFCGGPSKGNCWCDEECVEFGDCCHDVEPACGFVPNPDQDECSILANGDSVGCPGGEFCMPGVCLAFCLPDDPGCCAPSTCKPDPEPELECAAAGGQCLSSTLDVTFPAKCESEFGLTEADLACPAFNQSCCLPPTGDFCGGIAAIPCPPGEQCVLDGDFPDAGGHCVEDAPAATCEGSCGGPVGNKACWCDDQCESFGDCCADYDEWCAA